MLIFPAIDIYGGEAVRLYKGDYGKMTVYSRDPVGVACDFARKGAGQIHVVDLEGARDGGTPNIDVIVRIKKESGLFVEVGGGIRSMETAGKYLEAGIDRVILGTAAVSDPEFRRAAVAGFGDRVAAGVDLRDGKVAVKGWTENTDIDGLEFCSLLESEGVSTVICTDISRDGAMRGTNRELYRVLSERTRLNIIASGGISGMDDVIALRSLGIFGAIIGKAYYTGAVDLEKAVRLAAGDAAGEAEA